MLCRSRGFRMRFGQGQVRLSRSSPEFLRLGPGGGHEARDDTDRHYYPFQNELALGRGHLLLDSPGRHPHFAARLWPNRKPPTSWRWTRTL